MFSVICLTRQWFIIVCLQKVYLLYNNPRITFVYSSQNAAYLSTEQNMICIKRKQKKTSRFVITFIIYIFISPRGLETNIFFVVKLNK